METETGIKKNIAILGSTGSIGTQTLDIIEEYPGMFRAAVLTARRNWELLARQARKFMPDRVVITDHEAYAKLKEVLADLPVEVACGAEEVAAAASMDGVDTVVTAMVGYSGLLPTVAAIKAGKTIALANKETLVVAGELITELAQQHHSPIIPVDSEHGAIFQCLAGEDVDSVSRLIITASGGPFRTFTKEMLATVTAADALRHPTWRMGAKITIDSASLMNKGFEVMEARWLFGITADRIDVVVHPQSIVHSMVEFTDGSIKAQLGVPDMRLPIQYALSYPDRISSPVEHLNLTKVASLTFEQPDPERFPNLELAFRALRQGGNMPCVLNAANEVVVRAFLEDRIGFPDMSRTIERVMDRAEFLARPTYDDYVAIDRQTRIITSEYIK